MPRLRNRDEADGAVTGAETDVLQPGYDALAPHIADVLRAAAQAGDRIHEEAEAHAQEVIARAEQSAGQILQEAKALKAQAEEAAETAQRRAEAYAEKKREDADAEAAKILQTAEHIAALQHRHLETREAQLRSNIEGTEHRVGELATELRDLTTRLDGVLSDKQTSETLDEALRPAGPAVSDPTPR
jgi:chromosome segregation ATPase